MKAYADLADLPEKKRIEVIGKTAESGEIVGFFVDDDAKADRYIKKLAAYAVRIIGRSAGPAGTVLVRVGPRGH